MKKVKAKPSKNPIGRPTLYKPEYCAMILGHMREGFSVESFAGVIGVSRDSIYEWAKVYPDFSDTLKAGKDASLLHWERIAMAGMMGKVPGFSASTFIFNMKNRFGWRDQIAIEDTNETREYERALQEALTEMKKERK